MVKMEVEIPDYLSDSTLLKYGQDTAWDMKKAGQILADQLIYLNTPPKVRLTPHSIKLLQTGAFYLFGRDKFYRPTLIMDLEIVARVVKTEPAIITEEVFLDLFAFYWEYLSRAMFLPGQIV